MPSSADRHRWEGTPPFGVELQNPRLVISWDAYAGSDAFVRYHVYRRRSDEAASARERIAVITTQATVTYEDYGPAAHHSWLYEVTVVVQIGSDEIESAFPTAVPGRLTFDQTFVHEFETPANYVVFHTLDHDEDHVQDRSLRHLWGRSAPSATIGERDYSVMRMRGSPDVHRGAVWQGAKAIRANERLTGALLLVRVGVTGERFFATASALRRRNGQVSNTPEIELTQTYYDEEAAV